MSWRGIVTFPKTTVAVFVEGFFKLMSISLKSPYIKACRNV